MAMALLLAVVAGRATRRGRARSRGDRDPARTRRPPSAAPVVEPENKPEPTPARVTPREAPPPPPAPAQAAKVLTAEPKPDEPLDLTGNTIVTGKRRDLRGRLHARATARTRTPSTRCPRPRGVPGGTGTPQTAPAPARRARTGRGGLAERRSASGAAPSRPRRTRRRSTRLSCRSRSTCSRTARRPRSGSPQDPGNGFGREARRCAMNKHYQRPSITTAPPSRARPKAQGSLLALTGLVENAI